VQLLNDPTVSRPDPVRQADVAVSRRSRDGTSSLVVRRVDADGIDRVWLVTVQGEVRDDLVGQPEVLQAWTVDGGGVILAAADRRAPRRPGRRRPPGERRRDVDTAARRTRRCSRRGRTAPSSASRSGAQGQELATYQVMTPRVGRGRDRGGRRRSAGGGEALLERRQLVAQLLRQVLAELA
jgi:hypothetical protein